MKLAVTYQDGQIFQHFGHTPQFKLYQIEQGAVQSTQLLPTAGSGHGALATLLAQEGVQVLICGGIGAGAQTALAEAGIQLYGGVSGSADQAVAAFVAGTLDYQPDIQCSHHGHHHQEGHSCGSHPCGEDKGGCSGN